MATHVGSGANIYTETLNEWYSSRLAVLDSVPTSSKELVYVREETLSDVVLIRNTYDVRTI